MQNRCFIVTEVFNIQKFYGYRLNGKGAKASNSLAEAQYPVIRGNDLKIIIQVNADNETM